RRSDEEPVVVEMNAGIILVPRADKLGGVPGEEEILPVEVHQNHLLLAECETVEPAVCVFFEQVEIHGIVLETIAAPISEEAQAGLIVDEEKTAEIGVELLDAGAHGNEI